jgi:CheY-like chemotaxis protein
VPTLALRKERQIRCAPASAALGVLGGLTTTRRLRNLSIGSLPENPPYVTGGGDISGATLSARLEQGRVVTAIPIISIVDDDASVRDATARLLRSLGFSAHAFASAKEFLFSPRLADTSCLIADVQMPGMSGVELQEHLIANGHSTPMIFVTAFPDDRIRERAIRSGAVCFLAKPFDEPRLLECVRRALMRRQSAASPGASE